MKKLIEYSDNTVFYRGTIIVIKDAQITPTGNFDKKYCMVGGVFGDKFAMVDLYRSIGGAIISNLESNVKGHIGVNK